MHASKNIYEMNRELSKISESSNPGNLPEKMSEADHSKSTLECLLNEKVLNLDFKKSHFNVSNMVSLSMPCYLSLLKSGINVKESLN